jgi:hypothetical protein
MAEALSPDFVVEDRPEGRTLVVTGRWSDDAATGYRSLVRFDGCDRDFGCELTRDARSLAPGERGTGALAPWAADELAPLCAGHEFELREGTRIVGSGRIEP